MRFTFNFNFFILVISSQKTWAKSQGEKRNQCKNHSLLLYTTVHFDFLFTSNYKLWLLYWFLFSPWLLAHGFWNELFIIDFFRLSCDFSIQFLIITCSNSSGLFCSRHRSYFNKVALVFYFILWTGFFNLFLCSTEAFCV